MRPWRLAPVLLSLPLTACYSLGELGKLGFTLQMSEQTFEFESGDRVLLGSRSCPGLHAALLEGTWSTFLLSEGAALRSACYVEDLEGPADFDAEGCLPFDAPGEVTWTLTPTGECEYGEDRLRFTVVPASPELRLGFDEWRARGPEILGSDMMLIGLDPGRSADDLREDPAAPRLVVADALDVPTLRFDLPEGRVYWAGDVVELELVGEGLEVVEPVDDEEAGTYEGLHFSELALRLELGGVARVRATLPTGELLESPELIGVASSSAASLDLVALIKTETGAPAAAFAQVRDAEGRVLHGAKVQWSMQEGALAVYPGHLGSMLRTAEYAELEGSCHPPSALPVQRRAVLRARFGELEDTVTLVWTQPSSVPERRKHPFVPSESCLFADGGPDDSDSDEGDETGDDPGVDEGEGCGCTTDARGAPGWGLLPLLGLGLLGRRRGSAGFAKVGRR
ncbi:MAG: MYXO-CTERM sorting domain-containing protein [Enhygromyxa sp.]